MSSLIQTFLSSLTDLDHAKTLITTDARFIAVREQNYPDLPLYGTFTGAEGLVAFITGLRANFDTQRFHLDHVIETDQMGAGFGRFEHRIRSTGHMFRSHWAVLCHYSGGKIAQYRFYEDTAALEQAMAVQTDCVETIG